MTNQNLAHQRLHNQRIASAPFEQPGDVVRWLGAVQSQDYPAAKWAVAQRTEGVTDTAMDRAFADGAILRTHVLRPTWHFVTPADIRWMLALTAPRVNAATASRHRTLELDDAVFARSNAALIDALQGGKQCTRPEIAAILAQAGIATDDLQRLTHLLMRAELDAVICSGALRGKQHTYALLDERAPQATMLERDEALATLTQRYFTSHGPATVADYAWWSGLTVADAKAGLAMIASRLNHEVRGGQTYWLAASPPPSQPSSEAIYLLPNFDEYIVAYKDRSAVIDPSHAENLGPRGNVLFSHTIVIDGRIVGTWTRTFTKDAVVIAALPFITLGDAEIRALSAAAERYGTFLGMPVLLS